MARDDDTDWVGVLLGLAGAVALASLLSRRQCPYCKNYTAANNQQCQHCGGWSR